MTKAEHFYITIGIILIAALGIHLAKKEMRKIEAQNACILSGKEIPVCEKLQ